MKLREAGISFLTCVLMLDIKVLKLLTSKLGFSNLSYHTSFFITVFLVFASMIFLMEFLIS